MTALRPWCLVLAATLWFVSATSFALAQGQPLTSAEVEGFILSMHELRPIFEAMQTEEPAEQVLKSPAAEPATDTSWDVRQWITAAATHPKVMAVLKKHGFEPARFGQVSEQVMQAYTTLKLGPEGANTRAQMQAGLAQLESQPGLSAEQKQMLRQQMQESIQQMNQMLEEAPKADQDAVRPFLAKLDAVFEVGD